MSLYIDVDDTLVRWLDPLQGRLTTEWEPNKAVVKLAETWHQFHRDCHGRVIVWSLGGQDDAAEWGQKVLPHVPHTALAKYPAIPRPSDVFIDDDPLPSYRSATIHPDALG